MKYQYRGSQVSYGRRIVKFTKIEDDVPFDKEQFIRMAKDFMSDNAPFGCEVQHANDTVELHIYTD
jgi:hypothetical protein